MWHVLAVVASVAAAAFAFFAKSHPAGQIESRIGVAVLAFMAVGAFLESLDLFSFLARRRQTLARPMEGRYYPALFASGLLILVTLIVAIFALTA